MSGVVVFLGGVMNIVDPFIGLQIYIWLWIVLTFFSIATWLAFRYGVWENYKVLWGLYYAYKAQSNAAFIFSSTLAAELFSEAQAKCIFDYSTYHYEGFSSNRVIAWFERKFFNYATVFLDDLDILTAVLYKFGNRNMDVEIAKKLQGYEWQESPSISIGGTHTDIILDADSWTVKTSHKHRAVAAYCEMWNATNPHDEIHTYSKFQKYLLDGTISRTSAGLEKVGPEFIVPWVRIDAAFPIAIEDNEQGGARRQQAEDDANAEKNQYNKWIPHILIAGIIFAVLILGVRYGSFVMAQNTATTVAEAAASAARAAVTVTPTPIP
jgi:hypothetical protein